MREKPFHLQQRGAVHHRICRHCTSSEVDTYSPKRSAHFLIIQLTCFFPIRQVDVFTFVLIEEMTFTKATVCLYVMLVFPLIHVRQLHELVSLRLRVICFSRKAATQVFAE